MNTPRQRANKRIATDQSGFTLAELLIYMGITTLVIVTLTMFISDVSLNATRSKLNNALQDNARAIVTQLTQDVRSADTITTVEPTRLVLQKNGTSVTYQWNATDDTIYYDDGSGTLVPLSSDRIRVTSIAFSNLDKSIDVDLTVEQANPNAPATAQGDVTLHSSVVPRSSLY